MQIIIDILLETVRNEFKKPAPVWHRVPLEPTDLHFLDTECNQESKFDPTNKRASMYQDLVKGKAPVVIARCPYGQVTAVLEDPKQSAEIPWTLWARILRMYSEKQKGNLVPFKVYFMASPSKREFPPGMRPITPENINGGYTYQCNKETILIYRAEDATRVLLHELQHSCCLDHMDQGVDQVEAETEAWAELLYVALLSEGNFEAFRKLLFGQSTWMVTQNDEVKKHMKSATSKGSIIKGFVVEGYEFPWRYTLGKEEVWRRWGLLPPAYESLTMNSSASNHAATSVVKGSVSGTTEDRRKQKKEAKKKTTANPRKSLRLTFPVEAAIKKRFQVQESSTML